MRPIFPLKLRRLVKQHDQFPSDGFGAFPAGVGLLGSFWFRFEVMNLSGIKRTCRNFMRDWSILFELRWKILSSCSTRTEFPAAVFRMGTPQWSPTMPPNTDYCMTVHARSEP
jgi:hypothetical protein